MCARAAEIGEHVWVVRQRQRPLTPAAALLGGAELRAQHRGHGIPVRLQIVRLQAPAGCAAEATAPDKRSQLWYPSKGQSAWDAKSPVKVQLTVTPPHLTQGL